jgi:ferritin
MISKTLEKAINEQINRELYSEYLYLSIQAWFSAQNLDGFATWMAVQTQEERFHAMKFFHFVLDRGGKVELLAMDKPEIEFVSPLNAFKMSLEHEKFITKSINDLMDIAIKENDHASKSMLQWFVDEQVEEEANFDKVLHRLERVADNSSGLFLLDTELGTRVFTPPATTA